LGKVEREALINSLAEMATSVSGWPLSQDLIMVVLWLWARAKKMGVEHAWAEVAKWVGISELKMVQLIAEVYEVGEVLKKKLKKCKWTKEGKIPNSLQVMVDQI
jgi:hypothetical protein